MFESKHWYHCSRFFDTDACVSSFSKGHSNVTFATGKQILLCLLGLCNPGAFPRNPALLPDPDENPSRTKKNHSVNLTNSSCVSWFLTVVANQRLSVFKPHPLLVACEICLASLLSPAVHTGSALCWLVTLLWSGLWLPSCSGKYSRMPVPPPIFNHRGCSSCW